MDIIYECAAKFVILEDYSYKFVVSRKRRSETLTLNFCHTDFFHLAGLHYLTDISLPQNRRTTLNSIIEKKLITDELLHKSRFYINPQPDRDIHSRIQELRFLEEYLDTNNIIRIFSTKNDKHLHSAIKADYFIESRFKNAQDTVYIFLKRRDNSPNYFCPVSFFKKGTISYSGENLYWLLKEKTGLHTSTILYHHPNYVSI